MAEPDARSNRRLPVLVAFAVLALAAGAMFWPRTGDLGNGVPLHVFDPSGQQDRRELFYAPLAAVLAESLGRPVPLRIHAEAAALRQAAAAGPCILLVPDGLALTLPRAVFAPLAVGRRVAPRNLRPRGVLVWRRAAGDVEEPWRTRPARTIRGDSLSLTANGPWALGTASAGTRAQLAAGPDPYDHAAALHAARLGGFDYALVRQWDADRFLAAGLLDEAEWGVRPVTPPVPDLVLLVARGLPAARRLALGDRLAGLGRQDRAPTAAAGRLAEGLDRMRLAGFNLLIDADFDLVRGQIRADWLPRPE